MTQPPTPFAVTRSTYLQQLRPRSLIVSLVTGLMMGLMEVFFSLSFASLIFHGSLAGEIERGAGLALISSALVSIIIGLTSSQPGIFAVAQDVPAVLLAVIIGQVVSIAQPGAILPTVLAIISLNSLLAGLVLMGIGQLKTGGLIRYMPYPVIGGFLAATGWLLVSGSIPIMTGTALTTANLAAFLQPAQLILWLPGLAIALAMFGVLRFVRHPLALPVLLVIILAAYYGTMAATGTSFQQAAAIGIFPAEPMRMGISLPGMLFSPTVDWMLIFRQGGNIAVLLGMTLVGLLLNLSAIELVTRRDFDINHELRSAGLANLASGLAGSFIGYHMVGNTTIASRVGVRDRIAPLAAGLLCLAVVLLHLPVLNLIPKALFGGVLLSLGFDFLYDWVIQGWARFSRAEFAVELLILLVIVLTDFITGVAVGLIIMVLLFAFSYSRVQVLLRSYQVGEVFSTVSRSDDDIQALIQHGSEALVYELQGFLFFGTANVLLDALRARLKQASTPPHIVLIDFHQVTGMDSSAALSFQKIWHLTEEGGIQVVLTSLSNQKAQQPWVRLNLAKVLTRYSHIHILPDLDRGLEWCEEQVLARHALPEPATSETDPALSVLVLAGLPEDLARRAACRMTALDLPAGTAFIHTGDPADAMYIILSGQVSIYRESEGGAKRARTLGPGSTIGEIALYLKQNRSADVITDQPTRLLCLQREALEAVRVDDPALAAALQEVIVRQLAGRIRQDERGLLVLRG